MRQFVSLLACTLILVLSPRELGAEFNTDGDTEG